MFRLLSSCFSACYSDSKFDMTRSTTNRHSLTQYETNTFSSEIKKSASLNEIFLIESNENCVMGYLKEVFLDIDHTKRKPLDLGLCLFYNTFRESPLLLKEVFLKKFIRKNLFFIKKIAKYNEIIEIKLSKDLNCFEKKGNRERILLENLRYLNKIRNFDQFFYILDIKTEKLEEIIENLREILALNMDFSLILPSSIEIDQLATIFSPIFSDFQYIFLKNPL